MARDTGNHHAVTDDTHAARYSEGGEDLLNHDGVTVVADTGCSNRNAAAACETDNITA
jgi:hypothetical protein